jgi:hypothetical protein
MTLALEPIIGDAFETRRELRGDRIGIALIGNADLRVRLDLAEWLADVHAEALRLKVEAVDVDVTALEFMNSSCFKGFVGWLTNIMELPKDRQYRVTFHSNPETLWQRRSLHALRSFALMIVTVES